MKAVSYTHLDVAEKTNGHVTVEVFGNGQLGTEKEMLEQVVAGTVQGMRGGQFDFSPRLLMFTLPFLAQTREPVSYTHLNKRYL